MRGKKQGNKKPGQKGEEPGDEKKNQASGRAARKTKLEGEEGYETKLREMTPEEREAWGRVNDRDVANSLRELWGKIPPSYRAMVTQYFGELSDPDAEKPKADANGK